MYSREQVERNVESFVKAYISPDFKFREHQKETIIDVVPYFFSFGSTNSGQWIFFELRSKVCPKRDKFFLTRVCQVPIVKGMHVPVAVSFRLEVCPGSDHSKY